MIGQLFQLLSFTGVAERKRKRKKVETQGKQQ